MIAFIKKFVEWSETKIKIDSRAHTPPMFNEGEIWWCSIGENIGTEISGKGKLFRRPVIILRKLDRYSFIGTPLTHTVRIGSWYEHIDINGVSNTVLLVQTRHFDYRRMTITMCKIGEKDLRRIRTSYIALFQK